MHAHDRTLIASLGFSDPDKKSPMHDMACQYVARPEVLSKLIPIVYPDSTKDVEGTIKNGGDEYKLRGVIKEESFIGRSTTKIIDVGTRYEVPLTKGENQYKQTIGFLDVVIDVTLNWHQDGVAERLIDDDYFVDANGKEITREEYFDTRWKEGYDPKIVERFRTESRPYKRSVNTTYSTIIEVKANPVGAGDILRQFNLYREYAPGIFPFRSLKWVLATTFPMTDIDLATLKTSNIHHVRLGASFAAWSDEQYKLRQEQTDASVKDDWSVEI